MLELLVPRVRAVHTPGRGFEVLQVGTHALVADGVVTSWAADATTAGACIGRKSLAADGALGRGVGRVGGRSVGREHLSGDRRRGRAGGRGHTGQRLWGGEKGGH